jgi:protein-L-isoaspartate(D-aspartate) O-methyltransferase
VNNETFETMRRAMVASQLRTNAVNDARVVAAMGEVPRERFVPADKASFAYLDKGVLLDGGREMNPPMVTGRLLTEAGIEPDDHVLLVGAATGYCAALLGRLAGSVVALEEDGALLAHARDAAAAPNIEFVQGALADGWLAGAPYDLIFIDGAVELIPPALVEQLADGGRLAAAVVERGVTRLGIGRRAGGGFGMTMFADADVAPLPGFARRLEFSF